MGNSLYPHHMVRNTHAFLFLHKATDPSYPNALSCEQQQAVLSPYRLQHGNHSTLKKKKTASSLEQGHVPMFVFSEQC